MGNLNRATHLNPSVRESALSDGVWGPLSEGMGLAKASRSVSLGTGHLAKEKESTICKSSVEEKDGKKYSDFLVWRL